MKATTLLKTQHRSVKAIFKKLEAQDGRPGPQLRELASELAAHMAIEQEIFYPAVKSVDPDLVLESYEEHAMAEIALKRLLACDPKSESFAAHVTATRELIEHHVEEEEKDLFPKVEKKLGAKRLEELGAEMKSRFDKVARAGFAAAVPEGFAETSSDASLQRLANL